MVKQFVKGGLLALDAGLALTGLCLVIDKMPLSHGLVAALVVFLVGGLTIGPKLSG